MADAKKKTLGEAIGYPEVAPDVEAPSRFQGLVDYIYGAAAPVQHAAEAPSGPALDPEKVRLLQQSNPFFRK